MTDQPYQDRVAYWYDMSDLPDSVLFRPGPFPVAWSESRRSE